MSQFGCYIFDRLFCDCGACEACTHRSLMEAEKRSETHRAGVREAVNGFNERVKAGKYVSPDEKREKAKQRLREG